METQYKTAIKYFPDPFGRIDLFSEERKKGERENKELERNG